MILRDLLGFASKERMFNINFQAVLLKLGTKDDLCESESDRHMKIFRRSSS